jgi:hypothetical protein
MRFFDFVKNEYLCLCSLPLLGSSPFLSKWKTLFERITNLRYTVLID